MSGTIVQDSEIIVRERQALRRITLNRPKALNALTLDMAVAMTALLRSWAADPAVGAVLIDGAGERGLCAGGDIRALYDAAKVGRSPSRDVLVDRIPSERFDRALSEARDRDHGRHGDGRRRRHLDPRLASSRDRTLRGGDAGSRHRIFSRCRRIVPPSAIAGICRHLHSPDRRAPGRARTPFIADLPTFTSPPQSLPSLRKRSPIAARPAKCAPGSARSPLRRHPGNCPRRSHGSMIALAPTTSRPSSIDWVKAKRRQHARLRRPCGKCRRLRSR